MRPSMYILQSLLLKNFLVHPHRLCKSMPHTKPIMGHIFKNEPLI